MRKKFIAGNWKMNTTAAQGVELATALAKAVGSSSDVEVAVCPPAVYLSAIGAAIKGSAIGLGAQNCHHEAKGAFTGEVAPAMLLDVGWLGATIGFFIFRVMDIIKPWPANRLESLHGGLGIMADDVMAGAYGWLLLWGILYVAPWIR